MRDPHLGCISLGGSEVTSLISERNEKPKMDPLAYQQNWREPTRTLQVHIPLASRCVQRNVLIVNPKYLDLDLISTRRVDSLD